jgi:DNA-binding SARP family transcriptional activator
MTTSSPLFNAVHPAVHLFRGPYVTVGGHRREVPEGSKRLLMFTALHRRRMARKYVASALWPDADDGRAAGNLRSTLWRLRGAGIDLIDADKWSLALREDVLVDVEIVGDWAARLIDRTARAEDLTLSPWWPDALDLLPGWYDDWALAARERLRQRTLHALEELSRRLAGAGRCAEAVEAAMTAVSAEPLRESAQRALIEAHLAEGNLVEARRGYEVYRDLLDRELGVAPGRDLFTRVHAA